MAKVREVWQAVVGMDWADANGSHRAEPGDRMPSDTLPALPVRSIPWLAEQGHIRPVSETDSAEADSAPAEAQTGSDAQDEAV